MFELLGEICQECRGECCSHFAVYQEDDQGTLRGPVDLGYRNIGPRDRWELCCSHKSFSIKGEPYRHGCYFYHHGGCPGLVKPPECKEWFCLLQEFIIFGGMFPGGYLGLSMKLRMLYRGWSKEDPETQS